MNVTTCKDPKTYEDLLFSSSSFSNLTYTLNYPSNSYYPPGTVCAVEKEGKFCPTSGESGSPLMIKDDEGRMVAEGINSFIKVLKIVIISFFEIGLVGWFRGIKQFSKHFLRAVPAFNSDMQILTNTP